MTFKKPVYMLFAGLSLLQFNNEANAALAQASATIDWSSFQITLAGNGTDPAPTIVWTYLTSNSVSRLTSTSQPGDPFQYAFDWTSPLHTELTSGGTSTASSISGLSLQSQASDGNLSPSTWARSDNHRYGEFQVFGTGSLSFSVDYVLDAAIESPGIASGATPNQAVVNASLYLSDLGGNQPQTAEEYLTLLPGDLPAHKEGTLLVTLQIEDGEKYAFSANTSANANVSAVPVPAAAWLFGSGLIGLMAARKRTGFKVSN
ncbi:VPLPA-CTERM sorting domain-containing protein [Methylomonas sp. HW2-6]|uniref:VPLPA-CTERM sorting domain-containing protein n=1 Tax=Methylomonas sp. HW2-6 TaxID=3376687 RepID=UPI0040427D01